MQEQPVQTAKNEVHEPQLNEPEMEAVDEPTQPPSQQCFFFLGDTQNGKKLLDFFEGLHYSIFITIITLITLFADDFRIIFFTANEDLSFTILNLICMAFFSIEIIVLSFVKENYFLGFYFWLDMVSTFTMILDLIWIDQLMSGGNGAIQTASSVAKVARASRASKIGAKATKLIRIIRLIRFLKLYKTASRQLAKENITSQRKIKIGSKEPISKNSKLSANAFEQNVRQANRRWSRLKKDSSCAILPGRAGQVSLMNFAYGSAKKISNRNVNPLTALGSEVSQIPNKDPIIESIKKIETAARKRHTENIRGLAGFHSIFKDFHGSGSSAEKALSTNKIDESESEIEMPNETRVGAKVKDEIQKNLVIMILLIIISIPLFNASTWFTSNLTSYEKGIYQLQKAAILNSTMYDAIDVHYITFMMNLPDTLIYFNVPVNQTCCTFPDNYLSLRDQYGVSSSQEYRTDSLMSYATDLGSAVVFETTYTDSLTAKLNIGRTLFVCLILIVSTLLFARDIETIALEPLENMFETVGKIALNPLEAIKEIQEKNMCIESIEQELMGDKGEETEPNALENLIVKIGGLLAVGFGQAGTEIISKVIQNPEFVNVIIPGEKVIGIYGFCDIRNFTDATEILEAEVMVFVNQIAEICHSVVNSHCGSPNKNIGDAFLLVWKYKEGDTKFDDSDANHKKLELVETKRVKQMADLAVLSFVKMIAEITKSYTLLKYKNNKNLQNRIKDYKGVKMGFGLHVGWSIEGPIGSEYKVDASYLSPSVNMAGRLEAGTKEYGVPMLITGDVYKLMTENKHYLRQVDRVMFEGYDEPTDLYTVDLHPESLIAHFGIQKEPAQTPKQKKHKKIRENIRRNKLLEDIEIKYVTKEMWHDKDIKVLRQRFTNHFYEEWNKGFTNYVKGDWPQALESFKKTLLMTPDHKDGPSQTLISFIEGCGGVAPEDWKGFREAIC